MRPRRIRKLLATALGLIVLGLVWFYLAPTQLGGSATYVVTHGTSMEPRFHTGDLAIVRGQSSYHVGEVVAYHNHQLHTIVLHRIIARDGSRYVFKGDNNNFIDPEHPAASQLIGALWLHIPRVGATLQSIRSPVLIGTLVAIGVILLTGVALTQRRKRRRDRRHAGGSTLLPAGQPLQLPGGGVVSVLACGLLALIPFGVLAALAFARAPTASLPVISQYTQSGTLSYSAYTAPGPVYPDGRAVTGEPLFTNLIREVEYRYAYAFAAGAAHTLAGRAQLYATVAAPSGWKTTLALGSPTYFHGDHAVVAGTLDLASLSATLRRVESTTGVRNDTYTVTIAPHVSANGSLDGQRLHAAFSPASQFPMTEYEIELPRETGGAAAVGSSSSKPGSSAANPLASSASASVTGYERRTAALALGPFRPSVATARAIALGAIAIILCALSAAVAVVRRRAPRDASAAIRARYGHLIIPVQRVWPLPGVPVIDVADVDALARIAEHYDRSILHETANGGEAFWVADESGQFRYGISAPAPGAVAEHAPSGQAYAAEPDTHTRTPRDAAERDAHTRTPADAAVQQTAAEPAAREWALADGVAGETDPSTLADTVYTDELELGGVFAASAAPSPPEPQAPAQAEPRAPAWPHAEAPTEVLVPAQTFAGAALARPGLWRS